MADNTTYSDIDFLKLLDTAGTSTEEEEPKEQLSDEDFMSLLDTAGTAPPSVAPDTAPTVPTVLSEPSEPSTPVIEPSVPPQVTPVEPARDLFAESFSLEEQEKTFPTKITNFTDIDTNYPNIVGKRVVDLPEPTTQMYDDLRAASIIASADERKNLLERAQKRYQTYAQHPDAETTAFGEVRYKGKILPTYSQDILTGSVDVGITPIDIGGISSFAYPTYMGLTQTGPKALAEFGSAVIDAGSAYLFNYNPQLTERAQEIADLNTGDSIIDSFLNEGSGMLLGLGGANAMVNSIPKAVPALVRLAQQSGKYGKVASAGAKALALEAGLTAGTKSEADTLLIGENALVPIAQGIPVSSDDPEFEKVLARRANILADSLSAAKVVEGGGKLVFFASKLIGNTFVQPVKFMVSATSAESQQQDIIITNILNKLIRSDLAKTPEQYRAAVEEITSLIEEGANINIKIPYEQVPDINADVDAMSALIRSLSKGDTNKANELLSARASKILRKGLTDPEADQVTLAAGQVAKQGYDVLKQTEELLGGEDVARFMPQGRLKGKSVSEFNDFYSIDEMRDYFQNIGKTAVEVEQETLNLLKKEYDRLEQAVDARIRTDSSMFGKLESLSAASGIDINKPSTEAGNTIVDRIATASEVMDKTKNNLFNQVSGGKVDTDSLVDKLLDDLTPDQLTQINLPGDKYYNAFMRVLSGTDRADIKNNFATWATDNNLTFARLFTEVRPSLSSSISNLTNEIVRTGSQTARNTREILLSLRDYIDNDAIDYVRKTGDQDTVDAANAAMNYYKNTYAKFWKEDTTLAEIGNLRRKTIAKSQRQAEFYPGARDLVFKTLTEDNQEVGFKLIELLKRPEGGNNALVVTDYIIGNVFKDLAPKVRENNGLAKVDLNEISAKLKPYAVFLREKFPMEYKKVNDLVEFLEKSKSKKPELLERIKEAESAYTSAEQIILNDGLKTFFKNSLDIPVENGYSAMANVFNDANGVRNLKRLKDLSKSNPVVQDGMKSAFLRWAREDKAFIATRGAGDVPELSVANIARMESGRSNIMRYAEILFEDKPEFVNAFQQILEETNIIQKAKRAKALPLESPTAPLMEQQRRFNAGITQVFGVLNRWGARLRNVAGNALSQRFNTERYLEIQDSLLSDPQAFIEAAKKVVDTKDKVRKDNLFNFFVHVGIYREDPDSRKRFETDLSRIGGLSGKEEEEEPPFLERMVKSARDTAEDFISEQMRSLGF